VTKLDEILDGINTVKTLLEEAEAMAGTMEVSAESRA
jgi:hypothetical protein